MEADVGHRVRKRSIRSKVQYFEASQDGFNNNNNSNNFDDASSITHLAAAVYYLVLLTGNKTFIPDTQATIVSDEMYPD
jgi:hypothetical protein